MASMLADFVLETASPPPSTGTIILGGAPQGRRTWASAFANLAQVYYFLDDGSKAEWGSGTFTAGNPATISRDTVIWNTQGTQNRLNFTIATNCYNEIPAEKMLYVDAGGIGRLPPGAILGPTLGATPVGASMDYWSAIPPAGWLFCNGQAVLRSFYVRLFAVLGVAYGAGDGLNTFNVPDCRGRVQAGRDSMGGGSSARLSGVLGGNADTGGLTGGNQYQQFHSHALHVFDPGHAHVLHEPAGGHVHPFSANTGWISAGGFAAGPNFASVPNAYNTGGAFANVTMDPGLSNIGVTMDNTGFGGSENLQPLILCAKIIFAGN